MTLGFTGALLAAIVWSIGSKDGSNREFRFRYNAWEYGSAPYLRADPHFNAKTHVWRHAIKENKAYPNAFVPECLAPICEATFMPPEEVLCGLELVWTETSAGFRKLTVDGLPVNGLGIADDGIVLASGDRRKTYSLPSTKGVHKPLLAMDFTFPVQPGENRVLIQDVSKAKHYKLSFDALRLETVEADDPPPPGLVPRVAAFSGIVHPNASATLDVAAYNVRTGTVAWSVADLAGRTVARGTAALADARAQIALPTATRGWFEVTCALAGAHGAKRPAPTARTAYVVTEPVAVKSLPTSRFGCHAIEADGYRLFSANSHRAAISSDRVRRASLGGARWVRLHSISWALREPQKGTYLLDGLDAVFARVEKYKMNILLTVGQTPAWTSTSTNRALTCCGNYGYLYHPPKDWTTWGDFMKEVVRRYGNRISHYEIGNEPGYSSAFWTCGDAAAFGTYLKTAYEAIKSVKPDAVVYPGAPLTADFLDEATRATGGKPCFDVLSAHYLGNYRRHSEKPLQWRGLLRKYGRPETFVNSEDMSWVSDGRLRGPAAGAASMVRSHVRDAAAGIVRTFAFCAFGDYSDSYSFFTVRDEPKPSFAAYRAMTHRLEDAAYAGSLSGADFEAYVFDRKGTPVTVVWREEFGRVRLDFGAERVTCADMMDVESARTTAAGVLELAVGPHPVYVEGGDFKFLTDQIAAHAAIPETVQMRPGERRTIRWREDALTLEVPANAADGLYDRTFVAHIGGKALSFPVLMEVVTPGRGINRVPNGSFERGTCFWFTPKDDAFSIAPGAGYRGSRCAKAVGQSHFGMSGRIKVRYGETYLVSCRARGSGMLGACLSKLDREGRRLNGQPCLNLLRAHVTESWRRYSEIVRCNESGIDHLSLSFLPNYGDAARKDTLFIDDVVVARITERVTESKALHEGGFAATCDEAPPLVLCESDRVVFETEKTPWKGPRDLSAECRVALDGEAVTLRFDVTDDVRVSPSAENHFKSYEADSIQFAFDPMDDGRDMTSFMLGRDARGRDFLYKSVNYTTPELPENITRYGDVSSAMIERTEREGGYAVTVRIPLNEVYPLKRGQNQFGFGWIVNDSDGHGRKYMEWASGIGRGSSATLFGTLVRVGRRDAD